MNNIITFDKLCSNIKKESGYTTTRACINKINRMILNKQLYKISPNIYKYGSKKIYSVKKGKISNDIVNVIVSKYDINFIIWNISLLNEWLNHLINTSILILEVEKPYIEFVFEYLKGKYNVLLNPNKEEIYYYSTNNTIILMPLISKAPINLKEKTPKIEKIIIDIFSDKIIKFFYDGNEIKDIYEQIFATYAVNYKTLFAYSKRRSIFKEFKGYLKKYNIGDIKYL